MKKSPLRKVSKKREAENARYLKLRKKYLEAFPICEACKSAKSFDIHHKRGRGNLLCKTIYWMAVCRACHTWIGENPKQAEAKGWLSPERNKPCNQQA